MIGYSGPIRNVCQGIFDGPHATSQESDDGPIFLGISNVKADGRMDLSVIRHVSEQEFPRWTRRVVPQQNDIVFSYEATLHRYAIIPADFRGCLGRRMGLIRVDQGKVDPRYLLYYFLSPQWRSVIDQNTIKGATVDRIPLKNFPNFPIRIPPREQQTRIVERLEAFDALIENNQRRMGLLQDAARLLYREWFVHFRFPGHEHVKVVDGLPVGWERHTLGELATDISYGFTESASHDIEGPKFLRITDIASGPIDWSSVPRCPISEEKLTKFLLSAGDIVVARTGATTGWARRIGRQSEPAVFASYLVRFRFGGQYLPELAATFMESEAYKAFVQGNLGGAAQPNASAKVLARAQVPVPPKALQVHFAESVSSMLANVDVLLEQNQKLGQARNLLLPRMMDGEIVI